VGRVAELSIAIGLSAWFVASVASASA
jgi:hypothetical protein